MAISWLQGRLGRASPLMSAATSTRWLRKTSIGVSRRGRPRMCQRGTAGQLVCVRQSRSSMSSADHGQYVPLGKLAQLPCT